MFWDRYLFFLFSGLVLDDILDKSVGQDIILYCQPAGSLKQVGIRFPLKAKQAVTSFI